MGVLEEVDVEDLAVDSPAVQEADVPVLIAAIGSLINWEFRAIQKNAQDVGHL